MVNHLLEAVSVPYRRYIDYHISKLHIFVDELKPISGCQDVSGSLPFFAFVSSV